LTDSHTELASAPGDAERLARDLAQDLAVVSGALSEIATCWRRAQSSGRELPADRPLHLQDAVQQMEADVRSLAGGNPDQRADLALTVAGRFNMLRADIASAQSRSQVAGIHTAGDAELWNSAAEALRRAGTRLLTLVLAVSAVTNWSVNRTPPAGASKPWILIELGSQAAPRAGGR
jgi:hypothetical protein